MLKLRRGQGEYVAATVLLALLVSMLALVLEWQKELHNAAMKAVEDVEHSKEILNVHLTENGLEIINAWNGESKILAIIYILNNSFNLSTISSLTRSKEMFIGKNIVVEFTNHHYIALYPGQRKVLKYGSDPILNALKRSTRYICIYTEYNNIFCNFEDSMRNDLYPSQPRYSITEMNINIAQVLNKFVVLNYSNEDPIFVQLTNPSNINVFQYSPTKVPIAILLNFTKAPNILLQKIIYVEIDGAPRCSLAVGWVPCRFSTKYFQIKVDGTVLEPRYLCIYGAEYTSRSKIFPWTITFVGCVNNQGPSITINGAPYNYFIVLVDGIPILLQRTSLDTWSSKNLAEIALSAISVNGYTDAVASVTVVSIDRGFPRAILESIYSWRSGVYSAFGPTWGFFSNQVKLLYEWGYHVYKDIIYAPGYYTTGIFGKVYLKDIPLVLLKQLGLELQGSPPKPSSVSVRVDGKVIELKDFGVGYGAIIMLSTVDVDPTNYRVTLPIHRIVYEDQIHEVHLPIATISMTNLAKVSGVLLGALKNINCSITAVVHYNGKVIEEHAYAMNIFDFNIDATTSGNGEPSYNEMVLYVKPLDAIARDTIGSEFIVSVYYGSWQ